MKKIKIGTRGSKLALWQAEYVADLLQKGGVETELVLMETKGDRLLDVAISKIGSKGVFTEELEDALKEGRCDLAVHSAKDMPSKLPTGFKLIAFTKREQVNDVLVSHNSRLSLDDENLVIGTSSTRRVAMLKNFYPNVRTIPVRGNLQTRIKKMEDGQCDALLLAYAGVHRMAYDHMIVQQLPLTKFTPPTGQGSIAIEVHENLSSDVVSTIRKLINDPVAETELKAERKFLYKLEGGCSIPVFCLARNSGGVLSVEGGVISLNGKEVVRHRVSGKSKDAEALGEELADLVLEDGGREILHDIKQNL
ncbi:MAG: hydroxymethylbilane synthase [Candidatus Cyclobacteriaceae bacterium M2_1C_046]